MDSNGSSDRHLANLGAAIVAESATLPLDGHASPATLAPHSAFSPSASGPIEETVGKRFATGIHGEPGPIPRTADDFSRLLVESRLFDDAQLAGWINGRSAPFADCANAAAMGAALVDDKALTPYQVQVLSNGQARGLVFGKYEILYPLAEGGMGAVFRARHRRMRREVALKVLPRELVKSPDAVQRFHREVQAAAKLHHPNIAAAYDADEEDELHFLVMELVEGPNLSSYVAEAGELPAPVAVQLTIQAARGLAHAHLQGVVHRDIKPANLVVNVQGTLKILDMGLAQLRAAGANDGIDLTQMGQAMGTVDFMAPEQAIDASSVDHKADIYGLGCTLFFLLAARPISPSGSIVQKLLWHQTAARPALRSVCSDATDRLDAIFQRMVAIRPEDRYPLMRDVVEDLERVLPELRLGDADLPLIGDDLALYIGMDAVAPRSSVNLGPPADSGEPAPLHATLPPQKSVVAPAESAASVALVEQQLAAAAIMIGKEVAAETEGRAIRGVVNRLSVEPHPLNPQLRSVRLHVDGVAFGLHEIREVFYGNGSKNG